MKYRDANETMESAIDGSINFLTSDDTSEAVECANKSKPEELGTTCDLSAGEKSKFNGDYLINNIQNLILNTLKILEI